MALSHLCLFVAVVSNPQSVNEKKQSGDADFWEEIESRTNERKRRKKDE